MHQGAMSLTEFVERNAVYFVTFNFDRIIEQKFSRSIEALYGGGDLLARFLSERVVHVHGSVGKPPSVPVPDVWLQQAAKAINIVHDEIDSALLERVKTLIFEAEVVCFLGFGYNPDNLKKLGLRKPGPPSGLPGDFFGTAYGLGAGEQKRIETLLGSKVGLKLGTDTQQCLEFLKNHYVIRR
jgi:hypothetical protein